MKEKLESLKERVQKSKDIKDKHKKEVLSKIEEWYIEDRAEAKDVLGKELMKISSAMAPILEEIGLL